MNSALIAAWASAACAATAVTLLARGRSIWSGKARPLEVLAIWLAANACSAGAGRAVAADYRLLMREQFLLFILAALGGMSMSLVLAQRPASPARRG